MFNLNNSIMKFRALSLLIFVFSVFSFTQSKADSGPPGLEKQEIYKNIENQMPVVAASLTSDLASVQITNEN